MRNVARLTSAAQWSVTKLREKLVKIGGMPFLHAAADRPGAPGSRAAVRRRVDHEER